MLAAAGDRCDRARPNAQQSIPCGPQVHQLLPSSTLSQEAAASSPPPSHRIDVDPQVIEESPVLQRWLQETPDVAADIRHDPAFRTRLRAGYTRFSEEDDRSGFQVGLADVFVGHTPLTLSAHYARGGAGDRENYGVDAQYYLLPLGGYGNIAPVVGYRQIDAADYEAEGLNLGFRLLLVPSRGGAADLSLTQTWVQPGSEQTVSITALSVGYAVTHNLRLATDVQFHNAPGEEDSRRLSVLLEWMP